jgi:hypothetical protein
MRRLKQVVFVAVLALSLFATAGRAVAWDGDTPDPTGVSWEWNPSGLY